MEFKSGLFGAVLTLFVLFFLGVVIDAVQNLKARHEARKLIKRRNP